MSNTTNSHIHKEDLPSTGQLLRSTNRAFFIALAILVCIVYPAEYGVDPLGVGRFLGLTQMGEIKVSLQKEIDAAEEKLSVSKQNALTGQEIDNQGYISLESGMIQGVDEENIALPISNSGLDTTNPGIDSQSAEKYDTMVVVLQPNEGLEIKVIMTQGQSITYTRDTDIGHLNFDAHGESDRGDVEYYGKGRQETSGAGEINASFEGYHGRFFRNRSGEVVTLTLKVTGTYQELKQL